MTDINPAWARTIAQYPERYGKLSALFLELLEDFHLLGGNAEPFKARMKVINSCTKPIDTAPETGYHGEPVREIPRQFTGD